jgi:hypothetical protein
MKRVKKGEWYTSNDCKHNKKKLHMLFKGNNLFCNKFLMGWLVKSMGN